MCVIVAFVPYYAQMQTLRKIDIAENVEEIKLICILASINNSITSQSFVTIKPVVWPQYPFSR